MADAIQSREVQGSTGHIKENPIRVQVYRPRTGTEQCQLRQVPRIEHTQNTQLGRSHQQSYKERTQHHVLPWQKHQPLPNKYQGAILFHTSETIPGI
jgi:hypothetical protein